MLNPSFYLFNVGTKLWVYTSNTYVMETMGILWNTGLLWVYPGVYYSIVQYWFIPPIPVYMGLYLQYYGFKLWVYTYGSIPVKPAFIHPETSSRLTSCDPSGCTVGARQAPSEPSTAQCKRPAKPGWLNKWTEIRGKMVGFTRKTVIS